jgi:hypothetical protein
VLEGLSVDIDPVLDVGDLESEKADSALDAVDLASDEANSASDEANSASHEADSVHNDGKPLRGARRGTSSASDLACLQNEE